MRRLFFLAILTFCLLSTRLFAQNRIISLAPAATEILFAIGAGDEIVARTATCDYPPEVQNIPTLGGFDGKTYSIEALIALKPSFVYAYEGMHDHLVEPLERFGIQVFVSKVHSIRDLIAEIKTVGELLNHESETEVLAVNMQKQLAALQTEQNNPLKPALYWEVWGTPYMSASNNSFIGDIIHLIGAINIFENEKQAYPIVSDETIIARNPDIILYADDAPLTKDDITKRIGWHLINAVKNQRIYAIDADALTRPGPRILQAIEELSELIQ